MRQTSRAVALLLLLDSAAAGEVAFAVATPNGYNSWTYPTVFQQTNGGINNSVAGRLASRSAPYNSCPGWTQAAGCASTQYSGAGNYGTLTNMIATALTGGGTLSANQTAKTNTTSSPCVACIQNLSVWCSRSFSFENSGAAIQANTSPDTNATVANLMTAATGAKDNGSCCGTKAIVNGYAAKLGAVVTPPGTAANTGTFLQTNAFTCVAFSNKQNASANTFDGGLIDVLATGTSTFKSWWCNNGLYLQTEASSTSNYNSKQLLPDGANQRQELALVGCPQVKAMCGTLAALTPITGTAVTIKVDGVLTGANKCTFIGSCKTNPPAFSISKGTAKGIDAPGTATGSSGWIIHHMEYNDNQLKAQGTVGYQYLAASTQANMPALDPTTFVPQFTMGQLQYAKQRTWYGAGTSVYAMDNWSSPYQNGALDANAGSTQQYGNVAVFTSSTAGTDYSKLTTSALFDARTVRYAPLQGFMNSNAMGTTVASAYNAKKTEYDAAKTLWDNYVAILTKNAKVDAFAAAFAPPKAPTVPPLPNMPWMPVVANTMYKLSAAKLMASIVGGGQAIIVEASQPTTAEFWINSDAPSLASGGGWGSFTSSILKYREGWGKSYGTIGYEKIASNANWKNMGSVYDNSWQCATAVAGTATGACPIKYLSTATAVAGTPMDNVLNPTTFYVAVSLWTELSVGSTAFVFGTSTSQSQFSITWEQGAWSTTINALVAPATMAAATAATTLSGVLGAQALAASTAAALATAAALY